jgi:hypothetical protein
MDEEGLNRPKKKKMEKCELTVNVAANPTKHCRRQGVHVEAEPLHAVLHCPEIVLDRSNFCRQGVVHHVDVFSGRRLDKIVFAKEGNGHTILNRA